VRSIRAVCIFLTMCTALILAADEDPDYAGWIGMSPSEAWELFGVPDELFVQRGKLPAEDDVVFFRDGIYLFWFENRVWQVRADRSSGAVLAGVAIGDSRDEVLRLLGVPLAADSAGLFWELKREAYPLRLRVVFSEGNLVDDLYLYRGDY
jgi:hypothetical protein